MLKVDIPFCKVEYVQIKMKGARDVCSSHFLVCTAKYVIKPDSFHLQTFLIPAEVALFPPIF